MSAYITRTSSLYMHTLYEKKIFTDNCIYIEHI